MYSDIGGLCNPTATVMNNIDRSFSRITYCLNLLAGLQGNTELEDVKKLIHDDIRKTAKALFSPNTVGKASCDA